jgi:DNA-binding transcriptional MocR family regulator
VAAKRKFTRTPKVDDLVPQLREAGVGLHVLPTYHALLDHADNKTGRAWPSINRLADLLGLCRRTVERHLQALQSAGVVLSNGQGRGRRGRFSVCRYVVVAILFFKKSTVRHQGRTDKRALYRKEHKPSKTTSYSPTETAWNWWFGKPRDLQAEAELERHRQEEAKRRREGFEWFFGK